MAQIAIIGAGLMGRMLASLLAKQHQICLIEKDDLTASNSAGYLAAAMIAPIAESVIASQHIVALGQHSLKLWPDLLACFEQTVFFQQQGSLIVAHSQDRGDLHGFVNRLKNQASADAQLTNRQQIADLEPDLAGRFSQGLYLPNEGQVDNRALYQAAAERIGDLAVEVCCQTQAKPLGNGKVELRYGEQIESRQFDYVIDCRGLGAKQQLRDELSQLRGVRGEVARVYAPEVSLNRPIRLLHPRYPIYIAPKPEHEFVIGATEIESEDAKPPTVRSSLELLSAAYSVHPAFAEAEIRSISAGLRPTLQDNEPKIWLDQQLMQINGLYRHGYLLVPSLLQQVLAQLQQTGLDVEQFSQIQVPEFPDLVNLLN